jgi:RHS repeat-associated protein
VRQYLWGNYIDELLLLRDNDGTEYVFARDHLYSPVAAIAKADGTITERYEYDAYGKPYILDADYTVDGSSDIANPYLFTGRQLDTLDSGGFLIQYSRARYYDYETGRWYQRDPLGYVDGMGLYEYVGSAPLDWLDTTGLGRAPKGGPPGFGKGGKWQYPNKRGKPYYTDPKGHKWKWHDGDKDPKGKRHVDHWDETDKNGNKTRRDPKTGEDLGDAIDEYRNNRENNSCPLWAEAASGLPDIDYDAAGRVAVGVGLAAGILSGIGLLPGYVIPPLLAF